MNEIKVYDVHAFTSRFMPSRELETLLKGDLNKFLICRVEDMYRHVKQAVPASRSLMHACLYLTEGSASMKIGSENYHLRKGEILFVPAGQVFSFDAQDENKGFFCKFHDDMLLGKYGNSELLKEFEFLKVWGKPHVVLDEGTSRFVLQLFERILWEYMEHGLQHMNILQPYLIALLCEVGSGYQPLLPGAQTNAVNITSRFRELVAQNIRHRHMVSDYAAMLNISPSHLNKSVRMITRKAPTKWIDETIVQEAKVLLSQSDFPISEVAIQVGFEDQSYFTRLFKRYEGMTPTEFRRMIKMS
ncbi:AraC family transcriptional regulator [Chitinophaga filiformis]|uniref:AraC family transcriptional regulator n=1 Tax=Chitinophaga filiformis TaxID=104663 RepID=A0ABY4HX96_CHIFI|nr:AraC family transcriptional regulator [Chitinophaga filiformis]UPK68230.1 AraC family transcriptional regulator [Chitinophaga filiformis]